MTRRATTRRATAGTRRDARTPSHILEALEQRALFNAVPGADLPFVSYYPEGFVHDGISEFVPITNSNDTDVQYELWARYETGERDQLVASGEIAANTRGGVTLNTAGDAASRLVRPDAPYALELRASEPLGATMSHYDFGTAIGESFTSETSIEWAFAEGYKSPEVTRDFLVFYNPTDEDAYVAVLIYNAEGQAIPLVSTVGAGRRGGWNLNDEPSVPFGPFSIQVVSSQPIVAAMSHYDISTGRGSGFIGTPGGGATAGVLPSVTYDPNNRGADPEALPANSFIGILNNNQTGPANVTLSFVPTTGGAAVPDMNLVVEPQTRGGVSIRDLNLPPGEYGITYRSDMPVSVTASVYQGRDGTGMQAVTTASDRWDYGEGFMSGPRAGSTVTEDLYLFNPTGEAVEATIDFTFSDGRTSRITRSLDALAGTDINLHELPEVVRADGDVYYGIRVGADAPIVTSFEHWDDDLGGGFATPGTPTGESVPVSMIPIV